MAFKKPSISTYDLRDETIDSLNENFHDVSTGSFGNRIRLSGTGSHSIIPYHLFPKNFHEYDIHILDMNKIDYSLYSSNSHFKRNISSPEKDSYYTVSYPVTYFDPLPLSSHFFADKFNEIKKQKLLIAFAGPLEKIKYHDSSIGYVSYDSYEFYKGIFVNNKEGKEIIVENSRSDLNSLLEKYSKCFVYKCVFKLPTEENSSKLKPGFEVLIRNSSNEIISFLYKSESASYYFFPDCISNQKDFLNEFILSYCTVHESKLFPDNDASKWIESEEYYVPNESKYLVALTELKTKYQNDVQAKQTEIETNRIKYEFLHKLITETDSELVSNVKIFLEYVGFKNVIIVDHNKEGVFEEDLKVDLASGELLVIEVKGINGTSKDSECAQINKIKNRRMRERQKFDVYGLYIVNHQRNREPLNRTNPPFNENQIQDALNDERGLITTWELFKAYYNIELGIMTKEYVRQSLLKYGLIELIPDSLEKVGVITKTYKEGFVSLLNIERQIKKNKHFFYEVNGRFTEGIIENIKVEEVDIKEALEGEVGIKTNIKLKENKTIYIKK